MCGIWTGINKHNRNTKNTSSLQQLDVLCMFKFNRNAKHTISIGISIKCIIKEIQMISNYVKHSTLIQVHGGRWLRYMRVQFTHEVDGLFV